MLKVATVRGEPQSCRSSDPWTTGGFAPAFLPVLDSLCAAHLRCGAGNTKSLADCSIMAQVRGTRYDCGTGDGAPSSVRRHGPRGSALSL